MLLLGDRDNVDLEVVELDIHIRLCMFDCACRNTYAHALEQVLGVGIDIKLTRLGLGNIQSGDLRNVLILTLTLLLLKLEGDTADGATLDTLHKVGGIASNLQSCSLEFVPDEIQVSRFLTLLRRRLEAMIATSSHRRLLVSKSSVSLG